MRHLNTDNNFIDCIIWMFICIFLAIWFFLMIYKTKVDMQDMQDNQDVIYDEPKVITLYTKDSFESKYSPADRELLAAIVHAEAGNQDIIGKRLIVDVVLNRVDDNYFPDTVEGVIEQDGQFTTPAYNYTAEDLRAVDAELKDRLDYDVLWFRTDKYHKYGVPAYQHGDHYFSKAENMEEI